MRYIFYADVYFIQNFIMKVAVLYLALYFNKVHEPILKMRGIGKICIASFVGTMVEIVGFLFGPSYRLISVWLHLLEMPLMVWGLLRKEKISILRIVVTGYFFLMIINGVLEALWNQFGEQGGYIFFLLFSCGVVFAGVRIWQNYNKIQKGIFPVEIMNQGEKVQVRGFYDSGNRLTDPYTGKGVHVISVELWKKIGHTKMEAVYVPYQALGNEKGMLEVYYVDELQIVGEKGRKIIQKCPLGVTKDNLFEGKKYGIILNEEVF